MNSACFFALLCNRILNSVLTSPWNSSFHSLAGADFICIHYNEDPWKEKCYFCRNVRVLLLLWCALISLSNTERNPWLWLQKQRSIVEIYWQWKRWMYLHHIFFADFLTYVLRLHIICVTLWLTERCLKQLFRKGRRKFGFYLCPMFVQASSLSQYQLLVSVMPQMLHFTQLPLQNR